ncbi:MULTISPECIES: NUMOD1 domain-containing DNA-binding protein [Pseudomonadota]|uniref:NUMOD1 domain-containing DNA-binding protein n=1 Tax=Pseudomonadota TaxID=1224 RepID=UPI00261B6DC1|nr:MULTISPECIES: NUMOD1 domain-containing DNA-binding protein [Pseudomonadota]
MKKNSAEWIFKYHHSTPERFARTLYRHQKSNAKKRGQSPPQYTRDEFVDWITQDALFQRLYTHWLNNGRLKDDIPGVDRIDNNKTYSFSNIQVMTYRDNRIKYVEEVKRNAPNQNQAMHPVIQMDLDGNDIKEFHSIRAAAREVCGTACSASNIQRAIKKRRTAGGSRWRYK